MLEGVRGITQYNRVLLCVPECYRILQSIIEYYRVLQSFTEYYRVLKCIKSITRTNLAHLLGPIFGLVSYFPLEI